MIEINVATNKKLVRSTEMVQGHMYERGGIYYICNKINNIYAFSICGQYVVSDCSVQSGYAEVDAVITIG